MNYLITKEYMFIDVYLIRFVFGVFRNCSVEIK